MSRIMPIGRLPKAVYNYFNCLPSLHQNSNVSSQFYQRPETSTGFYHNRRNISFFSKKKFKEDAEEVLKENPDEGSVTIFAEEEAAQKAFTEEEIDKKRNVSRLRSQHYRLLHGEVPYTEPKFWTHHTVAYKRRIYGVYGEKSGVNPGILWPTKEELADRLEYESIAFPYTIQEIREAKLRQRQLEKEAYENRAKEVERNMALVEGIKAKIFAKQEAKALELKAALERKEKLMEEVRRHFGYTVDPKDERFQEMLQKKEKEQRKAMKEARKLEKQQKALAKVAQETEGAKRKAEVKKKIEDDDADEP